MVCLIRIFFHIFLSLLLSTSFNNFCCSLAHSRALSLYLLVVLVESFFSSKKIVCVTVWIVVLGRLEGVLSLSILLPFQISS